MNKMKFWKNILIILYLTKNMQNSIILHLLINNKENKRYKIVKHNLYIYTPGIYRTHFPEQLCIVRNHGEQAIQIQIQKGNNRQTTSRYQYQVSYRNHPFNILTFNIW